MQRFASSLSVVFLSLFAFQIESEALSSEIPTETGRAEWRNQIEKSRQRVEAIRKSGTFIDPQLQAPNSSDTPGETRDVWRARVAASQDRVKNLIQRMENGERIFADLDGGVDLDPTGSVLDAARPLAEEPDQNHLEEVVH
jgi:hypothetical protein